MLYPLSYGGTGPILPYEDSRSVTTPAHGVTPVPQGAVGPPPTR
jgi:hypothetical protein